MGADVMVWIKLGETLVPLGIALVKDLRAAFGPDVDLSVLDKLDADYDARIAARRAEAGEG